MNDFSWNKKKTHCLRSTRYRMSVTVDQKRTLINYIITHPDILLHSHSENMQKTLWHNLSIKMSTVGPFIPGTIWKLYWTKWLNYFQTKDPSSYTIVDKNFYTFLKQIDSTNSRASSKLLPIKQFETLNKQLELKNIEKSVASELIRRNAEEIIYLQRMNVIKSEKVIAFEHEINLLKRRHKILASKLDPTKKIKKQDPEKSITEKSHERY